MDEKVKVAALSIGSNTVLTLGKLAVGLSINSVSVLSEAFHSGLDFGLPEREEALILSVLEEYSSDFVEYHNLRTRKSGSDRYLDMHLVVPKDSPVEKVHSLCDRIEEDIRKCLSGVHVLIHGEPCGGSCEDLEGKDAHTLLEQCPACEKKVDVDS